jgi:Zn-dependent protease/predicted transcriptional regulator
VDGRSGFQVASIRGIEIRIDASWFILFFLILWSLSAGTFPATVPELGPAIYLAMGLVGTALFFLSLLLHELAHAVVARSKGIEVHGITLFVFGGMAHTREEPRRPDDELVIAGIGPVVSFGLGTVFLLLAALGRTMGWTPAVHEVAQYLGYINLLLAIFNLLPGYPLDGGRVFRAFVWRRTGNLARATRAAAVAGRWLGTGLIVLGIAEALLFGALLGGLWLALIGSFLRGVARTTAGQQMLERALDGVRAADVMARDTRVVDAHSSLLEIAHGAALRSPRTSFPVRDNGRIVGTLPMSRLAHTPRDEWSATSVGAVMSSLDEHTVVRPDTDMSEVLEKMRSAEDGEVLVMEDAEVVGSISREDLTHLAERVRAVARS